MPAAPNRCYAPCMAGRSASAKRQTGEDEGRRALVLYDRRAMVDLIELTLNHGLFTVRAGASLAEIEALLTDWQPHLALVDMEHDDSAALLGRLGTSRKLAATVTPVLGLTRRGDLATKLRAFDLGVDDIVTIPFSPEELLARAVVITRRASGVDRPIVPTIRLGEMEIDILNREVRAGTSVVHLSSIEQALLYLLASRAGRVDHPRRDPRRRVGCGLRRRKQRRRSAHPRFAGQAPERLSAPPVHCDRARQGLSIHPDVLESRVGRGHRRGRAHTRLNLS